MVNTNEGFKDQLGFPNAPTLKPIPVEYGKSYTAFLITTREELVYQHGNPKENLKIADCLSWETASNRAKKCSNKCVPVVMQSFFEGAEGEDPRRPLIVQICLVQLLSSFESTLNTQNV